MGRSLSLAERLRSLLESAFPPPDKVSVRVNDGLIPIVVSARFEGMDDIDRQNLAWNPLEGRLTRDEQREIAIIVTVTPKEEAAHLAMDFG